MLFKKKPKYEAPKTTNFFISFNLTAIKQWLSNKREIPPQEKKEWEGDSHVEEYKIIMLPHDPFLFYHEGLRTFSLGFSGGEYIDEYEIDIEWQWLGQNHGYMFTANRCPILLVPIDEIKYLLITGELLEENFGGEGEVIPSAVEAAEHCSSIFRRRDTGFEFLSYSNALAALSVEPQKASYFVDYSGKNKR